MKKLLILFILLVISMSLMAVDFRVDLADTGGDGWNGGSLVVYVNWNVVLDGITLDNGYGPESFYFPVEDGDDVYIIFYAGGSPEECEYYVYDNGDNLVVSCGLNNTYPADVAFIAEVVANTVDFRVDLYDSYGDGWNDGTLSVSVNGTLILDTITLENGYGPETFNFPVEDGDEVFMDYTAGNYSEENEYYVYNNIGVQIASSGEGYMTPEDITFIADVVAANYGTIAGSVTDTDGIPIQDAAINIVNPTLNYDLTTDENGQYSQEVTVGFGDFDVSCLALGYEFSQQLNVSVNGGETVVVDFVLIPVSGEIVENAIEITGNSFMDSGNTTSYNDDYEMGATWYYEQNAPDVVYSFTLADFQNVSVSLQNSEFDTQIAIYDQYSYPSIDTHIRYNDDFDFDTRTSLSDGRRTKEEKLRDMTLQSALMDVPLGAGTYYIVIDGITGAYGNYQIEVTVDDYVPSPYDESFEDGEIPQGWMTLDGNNDGRVWTVVEKYLDSDFAYHGQYFARAWTFDPYYQLTESDAWLITPMLLPTTEDHMAEFQYRSASLYWIEEMEVRLSTTGTEIEDFDILLADLTVNGFDSWQQFSYDLSSYMDQPVYLAVICNGTAGINFALDVDAFIIPVITSDIDLAVKTFEADQTPICGIENSYLVKVKNYGNDVADYNVKLYSNDGDELAVIDGVDLPHNETFLFELTWNPSEVEVMEVYAIVEIAGDEYPDNDESEHKVVYIQPQGTVQSDIGEQNLLSSGWSSEMPMGNHSPFSISETNYPSTALSSPGLVNAISYYYENSGDVADRHLIIRMGETEEDDLSNGVILAGDLELVFEGTIQYQEGKNTLYIPLDYSYIYQGDNLVIMAEWPQNEGYHDDIFFTVSEVTDGTIPTGSVGDYLPIDPYLPNEWYAYYPALPNTSIFIIGGVMGSLEGVVTDDDGTPMQDVELVLENEGTSLTTYSDENGFYSFSGIPVGTYDLIANSFGYQESITSDVIISENNTTIVDVTMTLLQTVSVLGSVFGSDDPSLGLIGAEISLYGYEDYQTVTDIMGNFQIDSVWANQEYELTIICSGYEIYIDSIAVGNEILILDDIILSELPLPVTDVVAELGEEDNIVNLSWSQITDGVPKEFRYDDGVMVSQLGYSSNNDNAILGSVYNHDAVIEQLSWYLADLNAPHSEVRILLFGLDENGQPDRDNLIYDTGMIPNVDDQWNVYTLPGIWYVEGGFYLGVMTPGIFTGLGMDDGVGEPYPFMPQRQYCCWDWTNVSEPWVALEDIDFPYNFLIRANGIDLGEVAFADISRKTIVKSTALPEIRKTSPVRVSDPVFRKSNINIQNRDVIGYDIWRFIDGYQGSPQYWLEVATGVTETSYVDDNWQNMPSGLYVYAVKAVFETGASAAAFSNVIEVIVVVDGDDIMVPKVTKLNGNYPNPFNPTTTISFSLKEAGSVSLGIYNIKGQLVKTLVNGHLEASVHNIVWDGTDCSNRNVASGVYFYKMKAGRYTSVKKMILLK